MKLETSKTHLLSDITNRHIFDIRTLNLDVVFVLFVWCGL